MKQTINIVAFFFVLSIPFALSSQTRKAIPAGRYEALSGVKNSRSIKKSDGTSGDKRDSATLFWHEVLSHFPENSKKSSYFTAGKLDEMAASLLTTKGLKTSKKMSTDTSIVFSDDLGRDRDLLKGLKTKDTLVVLKDSHELKEVMNTLGQYEVLLYQADDKANYFLLKIK